MISSMSRCGRWRDVLHGNGSVPFDPFGSELLLWRLSRAKTSPLDPLKPFSRESARN